MIIQLVVDPRWSMRMRNKSNPTRSFASDLLQQGLDEGKVILINSEEAVDKAADKIQNDHWVVMNIATTTEESEQLAKEGMEIQEVE